MKVEITERGAKAITLNRKPRHEAGDVIEVTESRARALVAFTYAKPVKGDEKPEHKPEETATDPNADERETRGQADDESGDDKPEPAAKEIRAWAKENDMDVPARGAIPEKVRDAYAAAHND